MATMAERYASKMTGAIQMKPADFVVAGQVVAFVTPDGRCRLMPRDLTAKEANDLSAWIKDKFIDGGGPVL